MKNVRQTFQIILNVSYKSEGKDKCKKDQLFHKRRKFVERRKKEDQQQQKHLCNQ